MAFQTAQAIEKFEMASAPGGLYMTDNLLDEIQDTIGYRFKNTHALKTALTHSSYANERKNKKVKFNERLEFLGDSVLSLTISEHLFRRFPGYNEGEMTRIRALVVCEPALSLAAKEMGLGSYLYLGRGEDRSGGRERKSTLSDAFEAVIGAIYLDGGIDHAKKFVMDNLTDILDRVIEGEEIFVDYKTRFQEILQKDSMEKIEYVLTGEEGPDHNKTFYTALIVGGVPYGSGEGKTKKESEQNAAREAIDRMGCHED